ERQQGRRAFGPGLWAGRRGEAPSGGVKCFGGKFTPDGSHVALAGAVRGRDGAVHVEAIRQAPMCEGTQWLVDCLLGRKSGVALVAVDVRACAGCLVNALRGEGLGKLQILAPTTDQAVPAHSMLDRAVSQGEVSYSGKPELDGQAAS